MKRITLIVFVGLISDAILAQVSGNINYQNQVRFPAVNIDVGTPASPNVFISVKGLANIKADAYVAIFGLTQVGKSTEEVNQLMDQRIAQAVAEIKQKKEIVTFVDMISFVPVYEYEVEKKLFSKKTYNEVPKGFELKKNIHIRYSDPNQLNDIINILAKQEIYDLVRVDYFSNNLETVKKDLMNKAKLVLQEKMKNYEAILGVQFANNEKRMVDGYAVMLPVEMYKSYESYSSSSLNLKKSANVNVADKSTTLYYQPVIDKEFDFVVNPTILEPVIQVMYEIKLVVKREEKPATAPGAKEYIFITPNGEMKSLNIVK